MEENQNLIKTEDK